jgi:ribulose-5-phosphate 4-epimerase/fuculose-1-phosphate aldolase
VTDVDEVYGGFRLDAKHLPDPLGWTPEEMAVRRDLAAAYQLCAHFGWDDLIYTHISARVPGPEHHFLVNPLGLGFDEITASNLIKIDLDGNVIGETIGGYAPNAAGFVIHGGIHQVRADARCVMHLHTEAQMALSGLECGLLPLTQHAMRFHGRIGYHDYEGIALSKDERVRFIDDLGDHSVLILRNHGTLTVGETVAQAFVEMYYLEKGEEPADGPGDRPAAARGADRDHRAHGAAVASPTQHRSRVAGAPAAPRRSGLDVRGMT